MNGYIRDILKHRDIFAGHNTVMKSLIFKPNQCQRSLIGTDEAAMKVPWNYNKVK
jgi:hypothetical protein